MVLDMRQQGLRQNPPFNALPIRPFATHDVCKPTHFLSGGFLDTTALKEASPDRIRELLRIFNWLAAPFGSAEDLLLTSGLQGLGLADQRRQTVRTELQHALAAG
jgi:putative aldouronate transport system substrate-binding protein